MKNYFFICFLNLFYILLFTANAVNEAHYPTLSERIQQLKVELKDKKLYGQLPYNFDDPDCNRTSLELIQSKGYPAEKYEIETEDGYILDVQRILAGQNQKPDGSRKPSILLQHGLEGCSVNWVVNLANQSLAYILADAGYDVWLCNSRGNTYSTKHATLSPKSPLFWQFRIWSLRSPPAKMTKTGYSNLGMGFRLSYVSFYLGLDTSRGFLVRSIPTPFEKYLNHLKPCTGQFNGSGITRYRWDHMAKYDLPAVVNYILNVTGNSQIYYAGHSQGTMIGFAQFSSDLDFAKKIKAFFALAPVAKVGNITSGIRKLAPYTKDIQIFLTEYGYFDFFPYNGSYHRYEYEICNDENPDPVLCKRLFDDNGNSRDKYINQSRISVYMSHCPAGTSTQNMAHYGQAVNTDTFQMFDYDFGNKGLLNQRHYGQPTPPAYNVTNLNVPTIVFHSDADALADPVDVAWLLSQINGTVVENYHYTDYSHGDFILAMNAATEIYSHIVDYIKTHENSAASLIIGTKAIVCCLVMSLYF